MGSRARSSVAQILGVTTVIYLLFLWTVFLNPFQWSISFPGGMMAGLLTMLLAMASSILAAIWGGRWWWAVAAAAVLTFVYIGFIYRTPLWY